MNSTIMQVPGRRGRSALAAASFLVLTACGGLTPQAQEPGSPGEDQALVAYGAEVYGYSCGRCHNPRAAVERSDEEWAAILTHMRVRADLTGRQARAVMAFLTALNPEPPTRVVYDTLVVLDTIVRIDTIVVVQQQAPEKPAAAAPREPAAERPAQPPQPAPPVQPRTEAPAARPPAQPTPEEVRRRAIEQGRRLVAARGCAGCHVVEGKGGPIGPSLDDVFTRRDAAYVRRKMANPQFDNPNSVMANFQLAPGELDTIMEYLRSIQRGRR